MLMQSIQQGLGRARSSWRNPATHPSRENCGKILSNRRSSFDSDSPFLFGEGLLSDDSQKPVREQLRDCLVVAAALQAADEVGCRPRLEAVEPLPRPVISSA